MNFDCNNLENGNWFTEISKINYNKNDPEKFSRFNLYYKLLIAFGNVIESKKVTKSITLPNFNTKKLIFINVFIENYLNVLRKVFIKF